MKISPLSQQGLTVNGVSAENADSQPINQRIRSLRMQTNATPGATAAQTLTIPDKVEQPQEPEATEPLSPQYAALAKQRRALQQERANLEREKAELEKARTQPAGVDLARLKSDPLGVLLEAGVTYEQLTEAVLANNSGVTPEITALKARIKELEEGVDKKLSDRDQQQEQQALAEMRREALQLIAASDDYALVRETNSVPKAIELIKRIYHDSGEVLDVREALRLVEEELVKDSLKIAGLPKVQSQLAPKAPTPQAPQQRPPMRTLTNRDTANAPVSKRERALAAFYGQTK